MVEPRTRDNRIGRHRIYSPSVGHGDETCPRCGWACAYLIEPYWDSPWLDFGGICGECAEVAAEKFDETGWPPDGRSDSKECKTMDDLIEVFGLTGDEIEIFDGDELVAATLAA